MQPNGNPVEVSEKNYSFYFLDHFFPTFAPRVMLTPIMASAAAIGIDVYGTLVDPLGISEVLRGFVGDDADRLAMSGRATQLEKDAC